MQALWNFADLCLGPLSVAIAFAVGTTLRVRTRTALLAVSGAALYLGLAGNFAAYSLSMYGLVILGIPAKAWLHIDAFVGGTLVMVALVAGVPLGIRALRIRLRGQSQRGGQPTLTPHV